MEEHDPSIFLPKFTLVPVGQTVPATTEPQPERLLDSKEVAKRLSVSLDWVFRHSRNLPFRVELAIPDHKKKARKGRQVRYSESGLNRWIASQVGRRPR